MFTTSLSTHALNKVLWSADGRAVIVGDCAGTLHLLDVSAEASGLLCIHFFQWNSPAHMHAPLSLVGRVGGTLLTFFSSLIFAAPAESL